MGFHYWGTQLWQNVGPVESRPQAYPILSSPESYKLYQYCTGCCQCNGIRLSLMGLPSVAKASFRLKPQLHA